MPAALPAGSDLRFFIRYSPVTAGTDTGTLEVNFAGSTFKSSIGASGIGAAFVYELLQGSNVTQLVRNQSVSLPDTTAGDVASFTVRVRNTGNGSGTINAVSVSGSGFVLPDLPPFPLTLVPNDFFTFTLDFVPTQPGRATGTLRINNDAFPLSANALGPKLSYSYLIGTATTAVLPGAAVIFSPTQIGKTSKVQFSIRNSGTTAATVTSIGVGDTTGVFQTQDLPPLPLTLQPNSSAAFSLLFSPAKTSFSTASLQIDSQVFILSGLGNPPPPLPDYQFSGASGAQQPLQQPAIGLSLSSPYPIALNGSLAITIESDVFGQDPAVQFASGGRTVTFTIPANSTQAIFPNGTNQIRLQTGTVASTIVITPAFITQSGLVLTPDSPQTLSLTISQGAPQLIAVQVLSTAANGFTLSISGYSTTRTLTTLGFQFQVTSDVTMSSQPILVDISAAAAAWYGNSGSQAFGSQFAISIPFTINSTSTSSASLISKILSVSVTASNELGASGSVSASLQ